MNRYLLNKATSSSDEPTPGYVYNEIYQMTFCSKESLILVGDFLIKKLQRNDLNVKLKTLKVLRHLCENKRLDIRNYLKKKIDVIKECQNCNIVNDELKGETPSMSVRKEASELIKLIYSYDTIEDSGKPTVTENECIKRNRIEGFGNTVYDKKNPLGKNDKLLLSYNIRDANAKGGVAQNSINKIKNFTNASLEEKCLGTLKELHHSNNTNNLYNKTYNTNIQTGISSSSKMTGFGNPLFNQHPVQKTTGEMAMKYLNDVANKYIPSTFVNKIEKMSAHITKNYTNGTLNLQNIINMNGLNDNNKRVSGFYKDKNTLHHDSSNLNSSSNVNGIRKKDKKKKPRESEVAGTYEKKVVDDVLDTSVVKKVPTENMLLEFAQKCETLDTKLIVSILTDKLKKKFINEEENWKHKFKVLCVIEYLLIYKKENEKENTIETLESLIHNLKFQTMEEFYRCKNVKQLKKKVNEIFVLLGLQQKSVTCNKNDKSKQEIDGRGMQEHLQENKIEIPNLLDIDDINLDTHTKSAAKEAETSSVFENKSQRNTNLENTSSNDMFIDAHTVHDKNIRENNNVSLLGILKDDAIRKNENLVDNEKKSCEDFFSYESDFVSFNKETKNNELFSSLTVKTLSTKVENKKNTPLTQNNELDLSNFSNSFLKENDNNNNNESDKTNYKLNKNLIFMENSMDYQVSNKQKKSVVDIEKKIHENDIPNFFSFDEEKNKTDTVVNSNNLKQKKLMEVQNDFENLEIVGNKNNYHEKSDLYFINSLNTENKTKDDLHLIDINCFSNNDQIEKKTYDENKKDSDTLLLNKLLIDDSEDRNFNFNTSKVIINDDHKNISSHANKEMYNLNTKETNNESDNTLDEIFQSFKLLPKKEKMLKKKDSNVNIDAFEILSNQMKL